MLVYFGLQSLCGNRLYDRILVFMVAEVNVPRVHVVRYAPQLEICGRRRGEMAPWMATATQRALWLTQLSKSFLNCAA